MTIAPLLGQLRTSAGEEAARRIDTAREEAARVLDAAARHEARHREAELAARAAHWARERERRLAAARDAGARATLAASERLIDRVVRAVIERAPAMAGHESAAAWAAETIAAAAGFLPDGPTVLRASPGLAPAGVAIAAERAPSALGVVVQSADGAVRVEATLERFLRAERPRLAQAILRRAGGSAP